MRERGVESGNWRLDPSLSAETVSVFYNWHRQLLLVAFRGSLTRADWVSNLRDILPGKRRRDAAAASSTRRCRMHASIPNPIPSPIPSPIRNPISSPIPSPGPSTSPHPGKEESSPSFRFALDITRCLP